VAIGLTVDNTTRARLRPWLLVPRVHLWVFALEDRELEGLDLGRYAGLVVPLDVVKVLEDVRVSARGVDILPRRRLLG